MDVLRKTLQRELEEAYTRQIAITCSVPPVAREVVGTLVRESYKKHQLWWIVETVGRAQQLAKNLPVLAPILLGNTSSPQVILPLVSLQTLPLSQILASPRALVIIPAHLFDEKVPDPKALSKNSWHLAVGNKESIEHLQEIFQNLGLVRSYEVTTSGEYAIRGGIIDVCCEALPYPLRIEIADSCIASLRPFDSVTQLSLPRDGTLMRQGISLIHTEVQENRAVGKLEQYAEKNATIISEVAKEKLPEFDGRKQLFFARANSIHLSSSFETLPSSHALMQNFIQHIQQDLHDGYAITIVSTQSKRLLALLKERIGAVANKISISNATIYSGGWKERTSKTVCYTDYDIFGIISAHTTQTTHAVSGSQTPFITLTEGCYVTHVHHGIGKFLGISQQTIDGITREYLTIAFAGDDKIYVPTSKIDLVTKYLGATTTEPTLSRLRDQRWKKTKKTVSKSVVSFSKELLVLYAERFARQGHAFPPDDYLQKEIALSFPYLETPDQQKALQEVMHDMESSKPMDRLLCGDVGFGKTEVALRAAVKAVSGGKQVVILAPTTILAEQHAETFQKRLAPYPYKIACLSRLQKLQQRNQTIQYLKDGGVDIVIGTHRLLQKDIVMKDLGLLIIDEEQRFGVQAKERLRSMRTDVDTLSLSATPIPRTLHLALSGIRDISVLQTPPLGRLPVQTVTARYSDHLLRKSILHEIDRGGQVFIIYNRVQSIEAFAKKIASIVPEVRVSYAHGQMHPNKLEEQLYLFSTGQTSCLVASTIIENGIDIPNANTIIVMHANHFGLADLYQLRGRVGRSSQQAYAYFLHSTEELQKHQKERLSALEELSALGSGFEIAVRDLDMRGAGDVFGTSQSGSINEVGFELYCKMVKNHLAHTQNPKANVSIDEDDLLASTPRTVIDIPVTACLPASYISDTTTRLNLYQQIANATTDKELSAMQEQCIDRFGQLPLAVTHLFIIEKLRLEAKEKLLVRIVKQYQDLLLCYPPTLKFGKRTLRLLSERSDVVLTEEGIAIKKFFTHPKEHWLRDITTIISLL